MFYDNNLSYDEFYVIILVLLKGLSKTKRLNSSFAVTTIISVHFQCCIYVRYIKVNLYLVSGIIYHCTLSFA